MLILYVYNSRQPTKQVGIQGKRRKTDETICKNDFKSGRVLLLYDAKISYSLFAVHIMRPVL